MMGKSCIELKMIAKAFNLHLKNLKLKDFARELIATQEAERKRIARDLHDCIGQDLSLSLISLNSIAYESPRSQNKVDILKNTIENNLLEIRELISNLDSDSISRLGIKDAFSDCIDRHRDQSEIDFYFKSNLSDSCQIDDEIATNLFRILQEALSNTTRHAKASKVNITLNIDLKNIMLTVQDNGIGFDINNVGNDKKIGKNHFGLSNMKERVYLLSGSFKIITNSNEGCCIIVKIPLNQCNSVSGSDQ